MQGMVYGVSSAGGTTKISRKTQTSDATQEEETVSVATVRLFAARGHMVQNPTCWRAEECDKTPMGNVNKEKSHFSSYLCFDLESDTFFCVPVWRIL